MGGMSDKYTDPIHLGRGCDLQMRSGVADTLRREKSACVNCWEWKHRTRRAKISCDENRTTLVIVVNRVLPVRSGCGDSKPHHPTGAGGNEPETTGAIPVRSGCAVGPSSTPTHLSSDATLDGGQDAHQAHRLRSRNR